VASNLVGHLNSNHELISAKNSITLSMHTNGWPVPQPSAKWLTAIGSLLQAPNNYLSISSYQNFITMYIKSCLLRYNSRQA